MAGISERLQSSTSFDQVKAKVDTFLDKQMQKLMVKESPMSWAAKAKGGEVSLADTLKSWIAQETYLPQPPDPDLNQIAALKRFWGYVCGQYAYCRTFDKKEMPLRLEESKS